MLLVRSSILGAAAAFTAGCVVAAPAPGLSGHYVGYVHLRARAPASKTFSAVRIEALGAWLETDAATGGLSSLGAGFRRTERIAVPLDCRLAVVVRDPTQMAAARDLINSLEDGACAIDATEAP
jgi:hypothetical protein